MKLEEIKAKARTLGLVDVEHMSRAELIHAIQIKEGYQACFGSDWCKPDNRDQCAWSKICSADEYFE